MASDGLTTPLRQSRFKNSALWGTIACGAGLFSDGYLNAVGQAFRSSKIGLNTIDHWACRDNPYRNLRQEIQEFYRLCKCLLNSICWHYSRAIIFRMDV